MRRGNYKPPHVHKITGFGIAVVDSKIYHLGGHYVGFEDDLRTGVYIFDTVTGRWSEGPSLNHGRAYPVFVGVIGRKIYVFGTRFYTYENMDVSVENWAECYDLDSKSQQWQIISGPTVNPEHFFSCNADAAVVYKDQILFWGRKSGIYAYNHRFQFWSFIKEGFTNGGPKPCFNFITNHAVIGDFAVWQFYGKIYAWDLTNHNTYCIWTLPGMWFSPSSDPFNTNPTPGSSWLVHVGNGLFCFLRCKWFHNEPNICCYTYKFQIKGPIRSRDEKTCHLTADPIGVQFYNVPGGGYAVHNVIAIKELIQ